MRPESGIFNGLARHWPGNKPLERFEETPGADDFLASFDSLVQSRYVLIGYFPFDSLAGRPGRHILGSDVPPENPLDIPCVSIAGVLASRHRQGERDQFVAANISD